MKKIISSIILLGISSAAMAVAPGGGGCGWGNMMFNGQSGTAPHVVAVTTNGTSGNNTFGMTTGTNGCSTDGTITYGGGSLVSFAPIMDELSEDIARGHGEVLDAAAVVIGIEQSDREVFRAVMHENFSTIFPNENVTVDEMAYSINEVMRKDTRLAKYAA